jgi:hypothetical protein
MTFAREDVAAQCRRWGGHLWLPPEIDGSRQMWALSGCESTFGANAAPRHEPAFDVGGAFAKSPDQAKLLQLYGSAGACSYGPWQIMLVNCSPGTSPDDMAQIGRAALETATFLNRRVLHLKMAKTVAQIAMTWNSGKWDWAIVPPGVQQYADDCVKYYENFPMPAVPVAASLS